MRTHETSLSVRFTRRALCAALIAGVIAPVPAGALELRPLKLPSLHLLRRNKRVKVAGLDWHTSYAEAVQAAKRERKMLVINFVPTDNSAAQCSFEKFAKDNAALRNKLHCVVLARIPVDAKLETGDTRRRLIDDPAFKYQKRDPGFAILDFQHQGRPYYGKVVTALPFDSGKYYQWENSHLAVALDLPAGTITQRTMVWAVRIHPEAPQSTVGQQDPSLVKLAAGHSAYQADIGVQGHQNWDTRFVSVRNATNAGEAKEVVAESWPDQDLIDSCIDCVQSWRQSPGHWSAVNGRQRLFGYDIRKGRNGIWYGTGIFAN